MDRWIVGPEEGQLLRCHAPVDWTRAPDWALDLDVLFMGEVHSVLPPGPRQWGVVELARLAGERARAAGAWLDLMVELPAGRTDDGVARDHADPSRYVEGRRGNSLVQLGRVLAPSIPAPHGTAQTGEPVPALDPNSTRVHAFDARADAVPARRWAAAAHRLYLGETRVPEDRRDPWLFALMGLGPDGAVGPEPQPLPDDLVQELDRLLLSGGEWAADQARLTRRVHATALKLGPDRARLLARALVDTTPAPATWGDLLASGTDMYLALRLLVRYRGAGPVRHAIVYAGGYHTRHVARALRRLLGWPDPPAGPWTRRKRVAVADISIEDGGPPGAVNTVSELVAALGLPNLQGAAAEGVAAPKAAAPKAVAAAPPRLTPFAMGRPDLWRLLRTDPWHMADYYAAWAALDAGVPTEVDGEWAIELAVDHARDLIVPDLAERDRDRPGARRAYGAALVRATGRGSESTVRALLDAGVDPRSARGPVEAMEWWVGAELSVPMAVAAAFSTRIPLLELARETADPTALSVALMWLKVERPTMSFPALEAVLDGVELPREPSFLEACRAAGYAG